MASKPILTTKILMGILNTLLIQNNRKKMMA